MDLTPLIPKGRQIITGYGNGGFKIGQEWVEGSILMFADHHAAWDVSAATQMSLALLEPFLSLELDILLIGTGKNTVITDTAIRQAFKGRGISLDTMDTGAACRTFNVLTGEERRVAAALIAI